VIPKFPAPPDSTDRASIQSGVDNGRGGRGKRAVVPEKIAQCPGEWLVQDLELREDLEDGQKTKIEKIVGKIVPVVKMLRYIGDNRMEEEFKKHGIKLEFKDLEDENSKLSNEATQQTIKTVLKDAVGIKQKMADESEVIVGNVFEQKVPVELQFNKEDSPDGIKPADFKKLVDVKTKLELAKESAQQKQKTEDQIKKIAEDKTFDIARLELVRDKLLKI
jgi:hypothetical protein